MKCLGIILAAALLAGVPISGSAQTQPQGSEAQGKPGQAAKSFSQKDRQAYQQKTAGDLDEMQQKIEAFRAKKTTVAPQKKRTFSRAMVDLQKKMIIARNKLAVLEKAADKEWSGLKEEMDKAMAELTSTYDGVESHFK
ncbi:MAG: sll1863 family stress response protein [Desulfobaccales bacterium]